MLSVLQKCVFVRWEDETYERKFMWIEMCSFGIWRDRLWYVFRICFGVFLTGLYHSYEAHSVLFYGLELHLNSHKSVLVISDLLIFSSHFSPCRSYHICERDWMRAHRREHVHQIWWSKSEGDPVMRWKICKELYIFERFKGTFLTTTDAANNFLPYYRVDWWLIHVPAILTRLCLLVGGRGAHSEALWYPTFKAVSHINDFFEPLKRASLSLFKKGKMRDFSSACVKTGEESVTVCMCVCERRCVWVSDWVTLEHCNPHSRKRKEEAALLCTVQHKQHINPVETGFIE